MAMHLLLLFLVLLGTPLGIAKTGHGEGTDGNETDNGGGEPGPDLYFQRVSTFFVCTRNGTNCSNTTAELLSISADGNTLLYTDPEQSLLGFVDVENIYKPKSTGIVDMGGRPTAVAVCDNNAIVMVDTSASMFTSPSGSFHVVDMNTREIMYTGNLTGQPGKMAVSPDCMYAAVVMPAGFLLAMDISPADPSEWTMTDISLTGLEGALYPDFPNPASVSVNANNTAVVTLQNNNQIVLIDLTLKEIIRSFRAGSTSPQRIDTLDDAFINQTESLSDELREPDGVAWVNNGFIATADQGLYFGGSRSFSVFGRTNGAVLYSSGSELEHLAASAGHYNDARSSLRGTEPETVVYGMFAEDHFLFVNAIQSNLVFVYDVSNARVPVFRQMLPTGLSPNGMIPIPGRNLLMVASGEDRGQGSYGSTVSIYARDFVEPGYPTLLSGSRENGAPIPFASLSGLSGCNFVNYQREPLPDAVCERNIVYTIEDAEFRVKRILTIDTSMTPPQVVEEIIVRDTNRVLRNSLTDLGVNDTQIGELVGEGDTLNLDLEGIAVSQTGGWWIVHEGNDSTPNLLIKVREDAVVINVIPLPNGVNAKQSDGGFEGVAEDGTLVTVVIQQAWGDDPHPMIGVYDVESRVWGFVFYPLETPKSPNGGWVGISDIAPLGDGLFLVLERDNQAGPDAAVKQIYLINLNEPAAQYDVVTKVLVRDILQDLDIATRGPVVEKVEGLTVDQDGTAWLVNDNHALRDNSGEIVLMKLGTVTVSYDDTCTVCMNNECVQCPAPKLKSFKGLFQQGTEPTSSPGSMSSWGIRGAATSLVLLMVLTTTEGIY